MTNHRGFMPVVEVVPETHDELAAVYITRARGGYEKIRSVRPNEVHALIIRADGSIEDLGTSHNLRTNNGADMQSHAMGGNILVQGSPATNSSATSLTATGTPYTASALIGARVMVPITSLTTTPVYGNIGANTTSVLTVDQWWTPTDTTGTTPATTSAFIIPPGVGPARFIGLTTDTGAPAAGDATLTSELNSLGMNRALATYAHTAAATSYTQSKTFTASGSTGAIHKAGMFTASTLAAGGLMLFETNLNADATLANGDQLALTWTVNI